MKRFFVAFIYFFTFTLAMPTYSGETIVYSYVNFPPFMYAAEKSEDIRGITKEILDIVAVKTFFKIEYQELPTSRFVHMAKTGALDFFVVSDAFAKQAKIDQLNVCNTKSVMTLQPSLFFPQSITPTADLSFIAGEDLLIPKEAFVVFQSALPPAVNLVPYDNVEMMSKMLINNRASFIIDYDMRTQHLLDTHNFAGQYQQLKLGQLKTMACMRNSLYDAENKIKKIQQAYVEVMHSDVGEAIFKKYNFTRPPQ